MASIVVLVLFSIKQPRTHIDYGATDQCPAAIQRATGLYQNDQTRPELRDVVLLVALNYGYYDFLQNWEWLASQVGLKWAVIALDDHLYEAIGSDRAIRLFDRQVASSSSTFREKLFNEISCQKMRVVLNVIRNCQVDVVFSDVDNVFLKDPFEPEFGKLIASRQFDYIFQLNEYAGDLHTMPGLVEYEFVEEANTGFYYLSKTSAIMQSVIESVLDTCQTSSLDDQTLFWQEVHKRRKVQPDGTWRHCTKQDVTAILDAPNDATMPSLSRPFQNKTVRMCNLDPYYHPVGGLPLVHPEDASTFHANFAQGKRNKIAKLQERFLNGYAWNPARVTVPIRETDGPGFWKRLLCSA